MKKDLKEAILGIEVTQFDGQRADLEELVNPKQLEEIIDDWMPEALSEEWLEKNSTLGQFITSKVINFDKFVKADKLQNLLVPKQELPVIPKFVAEWYESEGKCSDWWNWFYNWGRDESMTELEAKTIKWMQDCNEERFVDIFRYGYEVEEEQKYYVLNNEKYFLLGKDKRLGFIFSTGGNSKLGRMEPTSATFELTEQEIKDYDERYWPFAVKVEELEE